MKKAEVRALWRVILICRLQKKPDSQDICFVPDGRYARVIERLKPGAGEPGDIVHVDGSVLGEHGGIIHYTIGQRRGLGVGRMVSRFTSCALTPTGRRVMCWSTCLLAY